MAWWCTSVREEGLRLRNAPVAGVFGAKALDENEPPNGLRARGCVEARDTAAHGVAYEIDTPAQMANHVVHIGDVVEKVVEATRRDVVRTTVTAVIGRDHSAVEATCHVMPRRSLVKEAMQQQHGLSDVGSPMRQAERYIPGRYGKTRLTPFDAHGSKR